MGLYEGWQDIYDAFDAFLDSHPPATWEAATNETILYLIARDNEIGHLARETARNPERLLFLAEAALETGEPDANWQCTSELGALCELRVQAEALLLQFAHDGDEYVRRRALLALAGLGSLHVEQLAEAAWETGDEYQRMAVIHALRDVQSSQLDGFLARAESDGRQYLLEYAAKISGRIAA